MKLILETTTGLLVPAGVAPSLGRGVETIDLQFVTNSIAGLRAGGAPIAVKFYALTDLVTPIATVNAWTTLAGDVMYRATLDTLGVTSLAWLTQGVLNARVSYDDPNVDTPLFMVNYGGGAGLPGAAVQVVITQPSGPVNYVQDIGLFAGAVATGQTEGFWRVKSVCHLLGLQLNAQVAPVGADILVDVYKGGVAQTKIATLAAGAKSQETIFGAALPLQIGDVVQFRVTQTGVATKGSNLNVKGITQLL